MRKKHIVEDSNQSRLFKASKYTNVELVCNRGVVRQILLINKNVNKTFNKKDDIFSHIKSLA